MRPGRSVQNTNGMLLSVLRWSRPLEGLPRNWTILSSGSITCLLPNLLAGGSCLAGELSSYLQQHRDATETARTLDLLLDRAVSGQVT